MSDAQFRGGQVAVDEPQHVVRTYASDMAAVTGAANAAGAPAASTPAARSAPARAAMPPVPLKAKSPAPLATPAPNFSSGSVPIHEDIIADAVEAAESPRAAVQPAMAPAENTSAQRSSILDRLRARALGTAETPQVSNAPSRMSLGADMIARAAEAPTTNAPLPYVAPPPAPAPVQYVPPPVPPPPPPPRPTPPPAPTRPVPPYAQIPTAAPAPLHTFTSDFADRIEQQQASSFSVLAAQQDQAARPAATAQKSSARPIFFAVSSIVLVVIGSALAFFAFKSTNQPVATVAPGVPSLIFFDDKAELSGTGSDLMGAFAQSAGQALPSNEVRVVYLSISSSTTTGTVTRPGTGADFIQALGLRAPDILLRNIDPSTTVGDINDGTQTAPFFLIRVMSYDATFSGMLAWEPTMGASLARLYPPIPPPMASTPASSSVAVAPGAVVAAPQFVDKVVASHDVRELQDSYGNVVFLYGYADESTLIIARSEAAFSALLGRLQSTN